jgi:hypothetical protein
MERGAPTSFPLGTLGASTLFDLVAGTSRAMQRGVARDFLHARTECGVTWLHDMRHARGIAAANGCSWVGYGHSHSRNRLMRLPYDVRRTTAR